MTMRTRTTARGIACAFLAMTAGCDGASDRASAGNVAAAAVDRATFDPCVLSTADVIAITGDTVARAEPRGADCKYRSTVDEGPVVTVYRTGGQQRIEDIKASNTALAGVGDLVGGLGGVGKDIQGSLTNRPAEAPPTIGDEAIWQPNEMLSARQGDAFVTVIPPIVRDRVGETASGLHSRSERRTIAEKLAKATLAKVASSAR